MNSSPGRLAGLLATCLLLAPAARAEEPAADPATAQPAPAPSDARLDLKLT